MCKFKVGDKVQMVKPIQHCEKHFGMPGSVIDAYFNYFLQMNRYIVEYPDGIQYNFNESDIELAYIVPKKEKKMKFEVGNFYETRGGKKVKCISTDRNNPTHKIVVIEVLTGALVCLNEDGKVHTVAINANDVIAQWREPIEIVGWVAVYGDNCIQLKSETEFFETKAEAQKNCPCATSYVKVCGKEEK